jgi:hypothetical protein
MDEIIPHRRALRGDTASDGERGRGAPGALRVAAESLWWMMDG